VVETKDVRNFRENSRAMRQAFNRKFERHLISLIALIVSTIPVAASVRDCNEVIAEIDTKFKANGSRAFVLEIVDASRLNLSEGKIAGTCDGGRRRSYFEIRAPREGGCFSE
jgi:Protein of unknown function (DUF1161)